MKTISLISLLSALLFAGCASTTEHVLDSDQSQTELRSMQTRTFDNVDRTAMLKAVINTLQDLDFVVDKADATLGSVTASKFMGNVVLKMSVTTRTRENQLLVRANAQYGIQPLTDPERYQDFFNALDKSLFLATHKVD